MKRIKHQTGSLSLIETDNDCTFSVQLSGSEDGFSSVVAFLMEDGVAGDRVALVSPDEAAILAEELERLAEECRAMKGERRKEGCVIPFKQKENGDGK
jgi:hypothetical protein